MKPGSRSHSRVGTVGSSRLLAAAASLGPAASLQSGCVGTDQPWAAAQNPALLSLNQRYALAEADLPATRQAPEAWARAQQARQRTLDIAVRVDAGRAIPVELNHPAYLAAQTLTLTREAAASGQARSAIDAAPAEHECLRKQAVQACSERLQVALAPNPAHPNPGLTGQMDTKALRDGRLASLQLQLPLQLHETASQHTERGSMLELGKGWFSPGHPALLTERHQELARIAQALNANPAQRATIEDHTDRQGSPGSNHRWPCVAPMRCARALVTLGVANDRLGTRALGGRQPADLNDTAGGRRANRRVEIYLSPVGDAPQAP